MWFENFGLDLFVVPVDFAIFPMVNQESRTNTLINNNNNNKHKPTKRIDK